MKLLIAFWHQANTKEKGDPLVLVFIFFCFYTSFLMHNGGSAIIVMETGHNGEKDGCGFYVSGVCVVVEVCLLVLSSNLLRLSDVCDFHKHNQWRPCVLVLLI